MESETTPPWSLNGSPCLISPMVLLPLRPPDVSSRFRYPAEPPKGGKGCRVEEAEGIATATDRMPLLKVVQLYRSRETALAIQPQSPEMDRQNGSATSWGMMEGPQQLAIRPASAPIGPTQREMAGQQCMKPLP